MLTPDKEKQEAPAEGTSAKRIKLFSGKRKNASPADGGTPGKKRPRKKVVITAVILAVALLVVLLRGLGADAGNMVTQYTYAAAERRDIIDSLSGSGALEPADSYTVTTLVSGDILSSDFGEGDVVSKGDVLYQIDSSKAATSIERAEISISQIRRSYNKKLESVNDLTITAPIFGTVTGISVETGDTIGTQMVIASIQNTATLTITEYYSDEYEGLIYAGMSANVSVPDHMLNLTGQVKEVSSQKRTSATGISCFAVTVEVANPGSIKVGADATCWLSTVYGAVYPSITDEDGLDAEASTTVYAKISGTVSEICVNNNETVSAGQTIMRLTSDTLSDELQNAADSLKDAELSLQSQYDSLDDYTITAPIDGKIIDKYYKQGEKTEIGKALCIIYDLSSLTLTLDVDELDISQISVGQAATITADAVPGTAYQGIITKIGINGTTVGGVTTYPVSIRIDETDGLLPGMNVDVSIIVKESKNALSIPSDAVEYGGRVLVKTSDGSTGSGAPEGYKYAHVETGASDDNYVEVLSGLNEDDTVAYIPKTALGSNIYEQMRFAESGPPPEGAGGTSRAGGPGR